ncbi:hypothetical protein OC844_006337 [Tilletia horrida]|nr:hypothetical protein OC844_006337 [Tilletia horrida]
MAASTNFEDERLHDMNANLDLGDIMASAPASSNAYQFNAAPPALLAPPAPLSNNDYLLPTAPPAPFLPGAQAAYPGVGAAFAPPAMFYDQTKAQAAQRLDRLTFEVGMLRQYADHLNSRPTQLDVVFPPEVPHRLHCVITPVVRAPVSTASAASISARFKSSNNVNNVRTAAAKASSSLGLLSSAMQAPLGGVHVKPEKEVLVKSPIALQEGITLVKDRRLLGKPIASAAYRSLWAEINRSHRLQAFPVISRQASSEEVHEAIVSAFEELGHSLGVGDVDGCE